MDGRRALLTHTFRGEAEERRREEALKRREWRRKHLPQRVKSAAPTPVEPEGDGGEPDAAAAAEKRAAAELAADTRARTNISDTYQSICSLIKEAKLSAKILPGLLAALSAAGGRGPDEFFPQADEQMGRRVGRGGAGAQGYARRWARAWRLIDAEQRRTGLTLVERRAGGRSPATGRSLRSEYRVPLLQLILEVNRRADGLRRRKLKRYESFDHAARQTVAGLPRDYGHADEY